LTHCRIAIIPELSWKRSLAKLPCRIVKGHNCHLSYKEVISTGFPLVILPNAVSRTQSCMLNADGAAALSSAWRQQSSLYKRTVVECRDSNLYCSTVVQQVRRTDSRPTLPESFNRRHGFLKRPWEHAFSSTIFPGSISCASLLFYRPGLRRCDGLLVLRRAFHMV